jgi:hypothetical protein
VVAGKAGADAANVTLLPAGLIAATGGQAPSSRPAVKLSRGNLQAYQYQGLKPQGFSGPLTVYAVQTTAGVVELACYGPANGDCESVADSLKVTSGTPLPVGPDKAFGSAVGAAISKLDQSVSAGKKAIASASAAKAQAQAAKGVASAYGAAAKQVDATPAHPADQALKSGLSQPLHRAQAAYLTLWHAAATGNKGLYSQAQQAVSTAEQKVNAALAQFKQAGYAVS